jgi:hypothetical protein
LGENLDVLRLGRPAHVAYDTVFFISWPEHLGGGSVELRLQGTMLLVPFFAHSGDGPSEPGS